MLGFRIRTVEGGFVYSGGSLWIVFDTGDTAEDAEEPYGVRPVVVLQPGVLEKAIDDSSGSGTATDPFILQPIS